MKFLKLLVVSVIALFAFSTCQKELSFDNGGVSVGTLKSATTGDCLPQTLFGIFKKDSVLTNNNYIDVQATVIIPGSFNIKSDTIHGFSFSKTGSVGGGVNTIRLYASGKPDTTGTFTFTIKYDSSVCKFNVTVIAGTAGGANYTLGGAPGNCSIVTTNGTYTTGTAMTASNTVEMTVNVLTIGAYSVTTTPVNGVSFAAMGSFINPGVQSIILTATGTPAAALSSIYPVSGNGSNCNFSITYLPSGPQAVYTLSGAPGACTPATVNGTYTAGTALTASNNVDVEVNVTSPGNYTLSTNLQNGMKFSSSGTFTSTGLKTVKLLPTSGSNPVSGGTTTMTPQIGTSSCTFDITVAGPSDRVYSFKIGTTVYTGPCSGILDGTVPDLMSITGGAGTNLFQLDLTDELALITGPGTYSGTSLLGKHASFSYIEGFPTPTLLLIGDPNLPVPFTTNLSAAITSIDMINGIVQGTFSGTVRDASFNLITITNGTFKADF